MCWTRIVLLCVVAAACTYRTAPRFARSPLVTRDVARHRAAPPPASLVDHTQTPDDREVGTLCQGDEQVRFQVLRAPRQAAQAPSLVLLVPILAGGAELMAVVAEHMREQGFDVAFCERAGSAMRPPNRSRELDDLFRRTVLHQRLLLHWLRSADAPPPHVHVLGISMGGIVSTVLTALEPDLCGAAICLAGGDLASIVLASTEGRVQRWADWRRHDDGIGADGITWELDQFLHHEPLRFAAAIPTERVLMVSARFDTVIPPRNQDLLWEALGRPARYDLPLAHYSAALAIDRILQAAAQHFRDCERKDAASGC